jgi:hypothetical protein
MSTYWITFGVQVYLLWYLIFWICGFWFVYTRSNQYLPHIYICCGQSCNEIRNQFYSFQFTNTESFLAIFCSSMSCIITYFLWLGKGPVTEFDFFIPISLTPYSYGVEVFHFSLDLYTIGKNPRTSDRPVARPLPKCRTTQTQNKRTHTHTHTPNIHVLSGIRTHQSVRASEDTSCCRPLGYRDWRVWFWWGLTEFMVFLRHLYTLC